jgi:hypothetical protein
MYKIVKTLRIIVLKHCIRLAHFFDMYVKNHDGKHMTGDRIKILLLNLPFLLRESVT